MITVTTSVHFTTTRAGRKRLHATAAAVQAAPTGRVPRVSKLMAIAIKFDRLVSDGMVSDLAELARLASVTQPRMTQIMNLNHLAPDIQEELLFQSAVEEGRDPIHERMLRPVCAEIDWARQRAIWQDLLIRAQSTQHPSASWLEMLKGKIKRSVKFDSKGQEKTET